MKLSKIVKTIDDSATLALNSLGQQLRSQGIDVISFGAGEPDFNTPDFICKAAEKAMKDGFTRYTAVAGIAELREAICEKLSRDNGLQYSPDQILVSCGAKHSVFNAIYVLCEAGDKVVIPAPYWLSYPEMVKAVGAQPVIVQTEEKNGYKITAQQIERSADVRTRVLLMNSPNNPTGAVYDEGELRAIGAVAEKHGIAVISDEIYEKIIYDDARHVSIASLSPALKEATVVVNGFSKAYAMTGWRLGYAAGPLDVIKAMGRLQAQVTSGTNSIAQKAAVAALKGGEASVKTMVEEFSFRKRHVISRLSQVPGVSLPVPRGAFYVLVDVSKYYGATVDGEAVKDSASFCKACLKKEQLLLIPGGPFGADKCVRISFAVSMSDLEKGLDRFERFLDRLKAAK
jgi:aspartate aminotransferase